MFFACRREPIPGDLDFVHPSSLAVASVAYGSPVPQASAWYWRQPTLRCSGRACDDFEAWSVQKLLDRFPQGRWR